MADIVKIDKLNELTLLGVYKTEFKEMGDGKWKCTIRDPISETIIKEVVRDTARELLSALINQGFLIAKKVDPNEK